MRIGTWLGRLLGLALAIGICAGLWWLRPMPADPVALQVIDDPGAQGLTVIQSNSQLTFEPAGAAPAKGFIFYAGALVDPRAYSAMLAPIAAAGFRVTIVKSPYDLPIIDAAAAKPIMEAHPEITWWAVGGHSLGGVAAASYAGGDHEVDALVLWGSYPVSSLAQEDLAVLSVSGTNDGLTTPDDVEASRADLPPDTDYVAVEGAVHAFFGDYGEQSGDGVPGTSRGAAQEQIVNATLTWLQAESASS